MTKPKPPRLIHHAKTPRAAAIAGILFGILFSACLIMVHRWMPENIADMNGWSTVGRSRAALALAIMPFAGLAFLWFIGVVRDRLGQFEDQFFGAVMQGSGLLFLGMSFTAFAIGSGLLAAYVYGGEQIVTLNIYIVGRMIMYQIFNTYALKMASVFMISISSLWLNTGVMPRWLSFFTYIVAISMFISLNVSPWMALLFPVWVFCISVYILVLSYRRQEAGATDGMTPSPAGV